MRFEIIILTILILWNLLFIYWIVDIVQKKWNIKLNEKERVKHEK